MEWVEFEEAKHRPGRGPVTGAELPSPWSEAAKGIRRVERIPFPGVRPKPGRPEVPEWTGRASAPVALPRCIRAWPGRSTRC